MQDSLYSALFGSLTVEHRMDMVANNLANVGTTGFKREKVSFRDTFARLPSDYAVNTQQSLNEPNLFPDPKVMARPRINRVQLDLSQGSMRQTGNTLDFAINGEGFFKVRTPDGDRYTRDGHFFLANGGGLVTAQGYEVLSGAQPITLPTNAALHVDESGRIFAGDAEVGSLPVVTFDNPANSLEKMGNNVFKAKDGANETPATQATVSQGYLEAANVEVVEEMVNMIELSRAFEAYQKIMTTTQALDEKANQVGTTR